MLIVALDTVKSMKFTFHWIRVRKHYAKFRLKFSKYSDICLYYSRYMTIYIACLFIKLKHYISLLFTGRSVML